MIYLYRIILALFAISIFIFVGTTGCTSAVDRIKVSKLPQGTFGCNWIIVIDETFTEEQKLRIESALVAWRDDVPEMGFWLFYEPLSDKYSVQPRMVHVHNGYLEDMPNTSTGRTFWNSKDEFTGAEIYMNTNKAPDDLRDLNYFQKVMEHEFGHAFRLFHVPYEERAGDIMNPSITADYEISVEDVRKFYELHPACIQSPRASDTQLNDTLPPNKRNKHLGESP